MTPSNADEPALQDEALASDWRLTTMAWEPLSYLLERGPYRARVFTRPTGWGWRVWHVDHLVSIAAPSALDLFDRACAQHLCESLIESMTKDNTLRGNLD